VHRGRQAKVIIVVARYFLKRHDFLSAPILVMLLLFGLIAALSTFVLSLFKWYLPDPKGPSFIGLQNYVEILADSRFAAALGNSILFASAATALEILLGLWLSLYLHEKIAFDSKSFRVLMLVMCAPLTISPLVTGIFLYVLKANLNRFFVEYGIPFNIYARNLALPLLISIDVWQWTPFIFLIVLAKLHSLPPDILEAGRIDGASGWTKFRALVLPLLKSTLLVLGLLRGVEAFKVLDLILTTQGGPVAETETINFYIYKTFFTFTQVGYSAALTSFLTLIIQFPIYVLLLYAFLGGESLF
jgi:multiple sugar transport system permease protein